MTRSLIVAGLLQDSKFLGHVRNGLLVRYSLLVDKEENQVFSAEVICGYPSQDAAIPTLSMCTLFKGDSFSIKGHSRTDLNHCIISAHGADAAEGLTNIVESWEKKRDPFSSRVPYLQARQFVGLIEMGAMVRHVDSAHPVFMFYHGLVMQSISHHADRLLNSDDSESETHAADRSAAELMAERFSHFVDKRQRTLASEMLGLPVDVSAYINGLQQRFD